MRLRGCPATGISYAARSPHLDAPNLVRVGYATSPDDQGFVMIEKAGSQSSPLSLVQNWFEELKARADEIAQARNPNGRRRLREDRRPIVVQ